MEHTHDTETIELYEFQYQQLLDLHTLYSGPEELREELWQLYIDATNRAPLAERGSMERFSDQAFAVFKLSELLSTLWTILAKKEFE